MLTDFPADLAGPQIDREYIYPISTGAYWGRLRMLGLKKHGVADYKDVYELLWQASNRGEGVEQHDLDAMTARFAAAGLPTDTHGVADSPEQFFAKYPGLATDPRHFAVTFWVHRKADQPAEGGWRWHKWGPYVGEQESQAEYLHDEPEIEEVVSFRVYEIVPVTV